MELQTQSNKEAELRTLLTHTQELYKRRAENLLSRVQSLLNDSSQIDLLDNIHLPEALNYIADISRQKKQRQLNVILDEDEVDLQIEDQVKKQNFILLEQIGLLTAQIQEIVGRKDKYELAQKYTSNQILDIEDRLIKHTFNRQVSIRSQMTKQISPCLYFAYDELPDGSIEFKKSYKDIINHYFQRIKENQELILRLERAVKDKVRESAERKVKIQKLKAMTEQLESTTKNVSAIKSQCEQSKQDLRQNVQAKNIQIESKLPAQIDRGIRELATKNSAYTNTYHTLLEVVKKVIDNVEISKVSEYIKQT